MPSSSLKLEQRSDDLQSYQLTASDIADIASKLEKLIDEPDVNSSFLSQLEGFLLFLDEYLPEISEDVVQGVETQEVGFELSYKEKMQLRKVYRVLIQICLYNQNFSRLMAPNGKSNPVRTALPRIILRLSELGCQDKPILS